MKVTVKGVVKYVLMLALSAVLLYFAFRNMSWNDFITGLKSCNLWWIIATMFIAWIITIMRGNRWRLMMLPIDKTIVKRISYDAYSICYLANIAFPRSGEVVRCGVVAKTNNISFEGAIGSVVLERTWDMICVVICCVALLFGRFGDFLIDKMWKPFIGSLPFNAVWLLVLVVAVCFAVYYILKKNKEKVAKSKAGAKFIKIWRGLVDGVKASFKMEHKWAFFAYTVMIWIGYWVMSLFTIYAFPEFSELGIMDALFLMVVGSLGWIVPVQGGFGAYHFIVSMTLVPIYGVTQQTGLIFATISHESQIVQMLICGAISLISVALYKKKKSPQGAPVSEKVEVPES